MIATPEPKVNAMSTGSADNERVASAFCREPSDLDRERRAAIDVDREPIDLVGESSMDDVEVELDAIDDGSGESQDGSGESEDESFESFEATPVHSYLHYRARQIVQNAIPVLAIVLLVVAMGGRWRVA